MVQLVPPAGPPSEEAVLAEVARDAAEALVPDGIEVRKIIDIPHKRFTTIQAILAPTNKIITAL